MFKILNSFQEKMSTGAFIQTPFCVHSFLEKVFALPRKVGKGHILIGFVFSPTLFRSIRARIFSDLLLFNILKKGL